MQRFLLIKSSQEKSQVTENERMQISDCKISITVSTGWDFILDSMVCYGRLKANGQHVVLHSKSRSRIHKLCLSFIKSLVRIDIWGKSLWEIVPERWAHVTALRPAQKPLLPSGGESRTHWPGQKIFSSVNSIQEERAATVYSRLWFRRKESKDRLLGLLTAVTKYSE